MGCYLKRPQLLATLFCIESYRVSMGCYLKRPQLHNRVRCDGCGRIVSMGCYLKRPQLLHAVAGQSTTFLVSMGCYLKRPQLHRNGLCEEREKHRVSMGCYLKHPQLQDASKNSENCTSWFQWAATSNALSYKESNLTTPMSSAKFQRAATSNALSYSRSVPDWPLLRPCFNGLLPQTPSATLYLRESQFFVSVSMGCYLKRPLLQSSL